MAHRGQNHEGSHLPPSDHGHNHPSNPCKPFPGGFPPHALQALPEGQIMTPDTLKMDKKIPTKCPTNVANSGFYALDLSHKGRQPEEHGGKEMSVTKEYAVAVDTELADLYDRIWSIDAQIETFRDDVKSVESSRWLNDTEKQKRFSYYANQIDELLIKRAPLKDRVRDLNKIYILDPWTRAFLVINSNGHVHSSMTCNTCFDSTRYTWLVQYSNDDEATIVSDAGETACTICYPSAPADVLNRPSVIVTADKIAKAKAKAERDAKREAKIAKAKASAPTASGDPLVIVYPSTKWERVNGESVQVACTKREVINTERTAVSTWLSNAYWINASSNAESISSKIVINAKIVQALAGKNQISVEAQTEILTKKLAKRRD